MKLSFCASNSRCMQVSVPSKSVNIFIWFGPFIKCCSYRYLGTDFSGIRKFEGVAGNHPKWAMGVPFLLKKFQARKFGVSIFPPKRDSAER